ncbi:MAG: aquaporin family protein [Bacteroidetes bacterium]|nr:aquaporin family protein [Bacteroidota bacterium]
MSTKKSEFKLFLSEGIGTALLIFFGLSVVIFNWGENSVIAKAIPSIQIRRLITGFLFGSVGCFVTISPVGKISGAHINPAVSIAFWLRGKMKMTTMIGYVVAQMIGAAIGAFFLLIWGDMGKSVQFGITLPGDAGVMKAFAGEVFTTACLIFYLYIFIGTKSLRNYTPFGIPFLYCILVWAETALSGCSTNPARSFGPALVSLNFTHYWIYWAAPLTGLLLVTIFFRLRRMARIYRMESARVSYHNSPTPASLQINTKN